MRRGGLLLETLIALAIFTAAAGYTLLIIRDGSDAIDRAARRVAAVDLASARMAEIEAGIVSLAEAGDAGMDGLERLDGLQVEVATAPSAFEGLTLVEVLVYDTLAEEEQRNAEFPLARLSALLPGEVIE